MNRNERTISIIMPTYNSEKWIKESINSVQAQTYTDWELIITDDASQDDTVGIIKDIARNDNRIKLYTLRNNGGAAKARNNSLNYASGRYIAYLDSDDLWKEKKLELQIDFMTKRNIVMCYTDYDIVDEHGNFRKRVSVPEEVTYDGYLKKPITCTHSIMFDTLNMKKELLYMPNIRRGQDGATWLQILKTGIKGYALNESLVCYRRHAGSLSSNKIKAIKRVWFLYREVEKLSFLYSCKCFVSYAINALKKYL